MAHERSPHPSDAPATSRLHASASAQDPARDRAAREDAARDHAGLDEALAGAQPSWMSAIGAGLAPLAFLALWLAPLPLPQPAHRLAAMTAAVLVAWVTEVVPLPVTALAIAPGLVFMGVAPAKKAFAAFADPILFLFVGSFFVARAMTRHALDRRLADAIATLPWVAGRPARLRVALVCAAMALSMWMSNTGTTAILLPVLLGMISSGAGGQVRSFAAGSVLALAHASTTGGLATLVGTPPNAITARILQSAGVHIGFVDWMKVGVPTMLLMTLSVYAVVSWLLPAGGTPLLTAVGGRRQRWSHPERITALCFALAVTGWVLPDAAQLSGASWASALAQRLEPGAVAIAASALLFVVPARAPEGRVLGWSDAVQIEWGLILLFGGGIALGEAMFDTGLAKALGQGFLALTGVGGLWSLTAAVLVLAIVLTEICSNTAAANMVVPLAIGAAEQLGVSPIPPALAVGLGASCGFMLPVATGPNALAYGSRISNAREMIRVGAWLDLISGAVVFTTLRVLCPLFGWT